MSAARQVSLPRSRWEWSGQGSSVSASGRQRSRAATWRSSLSCSVIRSCRSSLESASRVTAAAKASHDTSSRSGPSRRTSMTATSVGVRSRIRRSTDRDTNRIAAGAAGVRPATAIVSTAGTWVVKPRCAAADRPAGPAPGPATASAISSGRGSGVPRRVRGPFQYRPLRTRMTAPELARRDSSHSTARRDPVISPVVMNDRVGAASTCSRTSCAALMRAKCNEKLSEFLPAGDYRETQVRRRLLGGWVTRSRCLRWANDPQTPSGCVRERMCEVQGRALCSLHHNHRLTPPLGFDNLDFVQMRYEYRIRAPRFPPCVHSG